MKVSLLGAINKAKHKEYKGNQGLDKSIHVAFNENSDRDH